jgi:hypothetical protein
VRVRVSSLPAVDRSQECEYQLLRLALETRTSKKHDHYNGMEELVEEDFIYFIICRTQTYIVA